MGYPPQGAVRDVARKPTHLSLARNQLPAATRLALDWPPWRLATGWLPMGVTVQPNEITDLFAALMDVHADPATEPEPPPKAGRFYADAIVSPERLAGAVLSACHDGQHSIDPATGERHIGVDVGALTAALRESAMQALSPSSGTAAIERQLWANSIILSNLATTWAVRALAADRIEQAEAFARLALKAQNQQRQTLATLTEIRSPKRATFIKQQNQAVNQQIINSSLAAKIGKIQDLTATELLEGNEHVDFRAVPLAIENDASLATVGALNRPEKPGRKSQDENERLEAWDAICGSAGG